MNRDEVIALMESSKSEDEWNGNCDKVKDACGGYPDFWYSAIIQSGLAQKVARAAVSHRHFPVHDIDRCAVDPSFEVLD